MHLKHASWLLASCAAAVLTVGSADAEPPLTTTRIVTGLSRPVLAISPPGDTERLMVAEQWTARIRLVKNGVLQGTPFLDINSITIGSGNERGLLGVAFHPDYATNRKFYVHYNDNSGRTVIREYLRSAGNPDVADASSGRPIFGPLSQPFSNHNGGMIAFSPNDGYLYVGLGDGGSGNDPGNRSQDITNQLLGKILRIDVDGDDFPGDANNNYAIPADNPFVGVTGDDEIWAYGVRNPWRFSFDRANGDLYMGDVGQNAREEINWQPGDSAGGENYGWRCMEGNGCTGLSGCTCFSATLTDPIDDYTHALGFSVTGGYVYRGSAIPGLQGTYFYCDYGSARIWSFRYDEDTGSLVDFTERTSELTPNVGSINGIASMGQDANGELYFVDHSGGEIFRLEEDCQTPLDCQQSFCDGSDLTLGDCPCANPGLTNTGCDIQQSTGGVRLQVASQDTAGTQASLLARGFPSSGNPTSIVLRGTKLDPAGSVVFGDGLRCVGTPVVRLAATFAAGGQATHAFGHGAGPGIFYYQAWFRNTPAMYCTPDAFNLSSGVALRWE